MDKPVVVQELKLVNEGEKYELEDILYATDSYDLTNESKFTLSVLELSPKNPNYAITIEGHTDDIGDAEDNLILSRNRALE